MDLEKQIENYVRGYKGGDRLQRRVGEIFRIYELIFKEEPLDIFITLAREGSEDMFKDCWIFSEKSVVKATDLLNKNDLERVPILKSIKQMRIETNREDYYYFDQNSTLKLTVETVLNSTLHMEAAGVNCDALKLVIDKYILPNLIE